MVAMNYMTRGNGYRLNARIVAITRFLAVAIQGKVEALMTDIPLNAPLPNERSTATAGMGENPKDRIGVRKPPLHLIPPAAEILESIVMGLGAKKYGAANWRSSNVKASIYIAAARRHLLQWFDGQDDDSESGVSHLAHARACLGILLDAMATGHLVDDRPTPGVSSTLIAQLTAPMEEQR